MGIQESDWIADLPLSPGPSSKISTADVYSLVDGTKRRLPEVAVAIDGGYLNIFDIKSATLVTGYAVSPQTAFTCPPLSVRIPGQNDFGKAQRLTYCATQSPKLTVQLFMEEPGNDSPRPVIVTKSRTLLGSLSPVRHIDILHLGQTVPGEYVLILVHENGQIRLLSKDLDREYYKVETSTKSLGKDHSQESKILCAKIMTTETAQEEFLRKRRDIEMHSQDGSDTSISSFVLLVSKAPQEVTQPGASNLKFRLLHVMCDFSRAHSSELDHPSGTCEEISSSTLTLPTDASNSGENFIFDEISGDVYHHTSTSFTHYKFDGLETRIHRHVHFDIPADSCLRIGPTIIATSTKSKISIINPVYNSLLSRHTLQSKVSKPNQRRRDLSVTLFSYSSDLHMIVALHGRALVTFSVIHLRADQNFGRKRHRDGTLLLSIGRGCDPPASKPSSQPGDAALFNPLGTLMSPESLSKDWEITKSELQMLAQLQQTKKFDEAIIEEFHLNDKRSQKERDEQRRENIRKSQWILTQIFQYHRTADGPPTGDSHGTPTLRIGFMPPRTFDWLVKGKEMSTRQIELALKSQKKMSALESLPPGAVIDAFSSLKRPLGHLDVLVSRGDHLTPEELTQALCQGLVQVERMVTEAGKVFKTETPPKELKELYPSSCSKALDVKLQPFKMKLQTGKTTVALSLIRNCVRHLHSLDARLIQRLLRETIKSTLLFTLIECLRSELVRGGWLSQPSTEDTLPSLKSLDLNTKPTKDPQQTIGMLIKVFNCTLNALGVTAWVTDTPATDSTTDTLSNRLTYMKAEISAVLEGTGEVAYLHGVLGDFLLYATRLESTVKGDRGYRAPLITAASTPMMTAGVALPLGLQPPGDMQISQTKVGTGGEVLKRSVREKELLRSQQVGEYRFETLAIRGGKEEAKERRASKKMKMEEELRDEEVS